MANNNFDEELERAVREQNLEKVKSLLSAGADANHRIDRERNNDTLLHFTESVEIAKELLLRGAYVNARNDYRETPLRSAVTLGKKLELVRELLKHGADVNATDRKGNTALNSAVKKRAINLGVVKELLEYGADINIRNRERRLSENCSSSLDNAVLRGLECTKLLIKYTVIRNFSTSRKIIDLSPYKSTPNSNYSELANYLDDCICEILQMQTDEIKDGLPLYEFVTNNQKMQVQHNNQLSVTLAKVDYSERYPIYNDIILDKVKPFLERADLLNKLCRIHFYTKLDKTNQDGKEKKIILDYDSTYNITEYLSNDDLLNFIVALDVSKKRNFQSLSTLNNLAAPGTRLYEAMSNDNKHPRLE